MTHPPAPWSLRGEAVIVPVPVRADRAQRFLPDDLSLVSVGGWTTGGVLLARYDETATLAYNELIVFAGTARHGARVGMWVSHIVVDLAESVSGGRRSGACRRSSRPTRHTSSARGFAVVASAHPFR